MSLIIFIKNAIKGKVKTRLAASVGEDRAMQIYQALLGHTRQTALSIPVKRHLFYSHFIEAEDEWSTDDFVKELQSGADLGERLINACQSVFATSDKVVIIGSDCPTLTPAILQQAFDQLDQYPFVIGPALDGGYYLLGMKEFAPSLFQQINWSTETVLQETVQAIEALQKTYSLLPALSDIDYESDWDKFGWKI